MFSLSTFQSKGDCHNLFYLKTFDAMSPSIRTLINEFKNVVFAKVDLEKSKYFKTKRLLPHLFIRESKSNVADKLLDFEE